MIMSGFSSSSRYSLLIVDDEPAITEYLNRIISNEYTNVDVRTAANGLEALDSIVMSMPDAIIVDIIMPVMTGAEVIRKIRKNPACAHIPILAFSAHMRTAEKEIINIGANAFFRKPSEIPELVQSLAKFLPGLIPSKQN